MSEFGTAVVVGGASGIGESCSRLMVARGWDVVIVDRDEAGAAIAVDAGALFRRADITSADEIDAVANELNRLGSGVAAVVVTAAAFQDTLAPQDIGDDVWDRIVAVNLTGTYRVNKAFGLRMVERGKGAIVNVSSVAGIASTPLHAYGPAKAGVISLVQSLAGEWGRAGVRINCVTPGLTLTPRIAARLKAGVRYAGAPGDHTALGRPVYPAEVAEAIEFLASPRASGITGSNLVVDAGMVVAGTWGMYGGVRKK